MGNIAIYITRGGVVVEIADFSGRQRIELEPWEVEELIAALVEANQIAREGMH